MISHSIIVPHYNRLANLNRCLVSIARSAERCGIEDYEVIVVNNGPQDPGFALMPNVIYAMLPDKPATFNKPALQCCGILMAQGNVLTFLDADALVPLWFMDNPEKLLRDPSLTKLCYRVRKLPEGAPDDQSTLFGNYNSYPRAMEAYRKPHTGWLPPFQEHRFIRDKEPVFGNSQFSITKEALGPVLPDPAFFCRGYEDIYFNLQIWAYHYQDYRAEMVTDADHALLHLPNPPDADAQWGGIQQGANENLYHSRWHRFQLLARKKRYRELRQFACETTIQP